MASSETGCALAWPPGGGCIQSKRIVEDRSIQRKILELIVATCKGIAIRRRGKSKNILRRARYRGYLGQLRIVNGGRGSRPAVINLFRSGTDYQF